MIDFIKIAKRIASGDASCVYVDLDETLIHTVELNDLVSQAVFKAYPGEKISFSQYGIMLRPGAIQLLDDLRALNVPIYILTHSVSSYATTIIEAFGFDVDAIFPRESLMGSVGNGEKKFVLIDDLDPTHMVFQMKAQAMGVKLISNLNEEQQREYFSAWHICPPQFLGNPLDKGLDGVAEKASSMLGVV